MKEFFEISGVILWVITIIYVTVTIISNKKQSYSTKEDNTLRYEEHWCNKCQDITEHEVSGSGFSEWMICLNCDTK